MDAAWHAHGICRKQMALWGAWEVDHTSGAQDSPWGPFLCKWSLRCGVDEIMWRAERRNTTLGTV